MGIQSEVKIGGPIVLAATATVVALGASANGRGVKWDDATGKLVLAEDGDRVDFIVDDVYEASNEVGAIPFEANRQFRVRMAASLTSALANGKTVKIGAAGLFDAGGASGDVNVAVCEEPAPANAYALVRPLPGGNFTTA